MRYNAAVTPRFILLTFASCIVLFAAIWAATAPKSGPAPIAAAPAAAVMYADCDAVRAANAAPLRADQPGYRPMLDSNMNGIACEAVGAPDAAAPQGASAPAVDQPPPAAENPVEPPVEQPVEQPSTPEPNGERLRPEM